MIAIQIKHSRNMTNMQQEMMVVVFWVASVLKSQTILEYPPHPSDIWWHLWMEWTDIFDIYTTPAESLASQIVCHTTSKVKWENKSKRLIHEIFQWP